MCATENHLGAGPKAVESHSVFEQGLAEHWVSGGQGGVEPQKRLPALGIWLKIRKAAPIQAMRRREFSTDIHEISPMAGGADFAG